MEFNRIIAHQRILEKYKKAIQAQRLAHAHMVVSCDGGGCLPFALSLAQEILCGNFPPNHPHRELFRKFEHPDLTFSFPVITKKSEGIQSVEKMNEWREQLQQDVYFTYAHWSVVMSDGTAKKPIIYTKEAEFIGKRLSLKAYLGGAKVLIIWMPELLHPTAANKLLKLIEEPTGHTYFILASHHPDNVLATIRSRTQMVMLPNAESEEIEYLLKDEYDVEDTRACLIASAADGSLGAAREGATMDGDHRITFNLFRDMLRKCFAADIENIPNLVEEIAALKREEVKLMIDMGLRLFRACALSHYTSEVNKSLSLDERKLVEGLGPFIQTEAIEKLYELFSEAHHHLHRNAYLKILLLDLFLDVAVVINQERRKAAAAR